MVAGKRKYFKKSLGRKKYYNKRKKAFFNTSKNYQYLKVNFTRYIVPLVDTGSSTMTGYSFAQAYNTSAAMFNDTFSIIYQLSDLTEFARLKQQYSAYRIRGCRIKIVKLVDPHEQLGIENKNKYPIKLYFNINRQVSNEEISMGTSYNIFNHTKVIDKYFNNKVKEWQRTDYDKDNIGTYGDNNNGHIHIVGTSPDGAESADKNNYPHYQMYFTYYILFKDNKFN